MNQLSISEQDFNIFDIKGLDQRMAAIKEILRPKLDYIGQELTPYLSILTGDENYYHVAKHARRTVNPPNDTWVAWSASKRGYKALPHFQVGMWSTHLFIWFAMIYEAPNKASYAQQIQKHLHQVMDTIPDNFVWSIDHTKPDVIPHKNLTSDELKVMTDRLQNVKKAELLCGIIIKKEEFLSQKYELIKTIEQTFNKLSYLYQLAKK